jgi:hypothetical protein
MHTLDPKEVVLTNGYSLCTIYYLQQSKMQKTIVLTLLATLNLKKQHPDFILFTQP